MHPCSDFSGEGPSPLDLPIPAALKQQWLDLATRRQFLGRSGKVLGWAGLAKLMTGNAMASGGGGDHGVLLPHYAPKAKRAIYLFMAGAPSQFETWDYKPELAKRFDQDLPESVRGGQVLTGMTASQSRFPIAPSIYGFQQHGQAGHWVNELFPHTSKVSDEFAIMKSLHTDAINHEPAILLANSGNMVPGKASIGSWISYGLGSMNEDLPTFVVLTSKLPIFTNIQALSSRLWSSGFLSPEHAGVALRSGGDPVIHLSNPKGVSRELRRAMIDGVNDMNRQLHERIGDPETNARIAQYEMAFRMQASVPELTDLSNEPESIWQMYGPRAKEPGTYAYNCLMARRMAERGVRFTQIFHRGWDLHTNLPAGMKTLAEDVDQPTAALIADLKQRGLLDDTLVVWGGEFGRTVYSQGGLTKENYGRDHHPRCFSMWMAGGGVKPGMVYGETDDFSYNIVKDPMHIRDLNATILHLLGIDHEKLTFKFQGLEQKLTGVEPAKVVKELLA
ncbi:DUF1501 domain-containing protein [Luteolibacter sp. GHJ8]|uniref:DUF1501 domain-containing protein n=1 Tax=Luteolibacter rhizosphaerae TaxID=2989719 RepID=A0ABT3FXU3_9BACT|nr:DUF1501 domain-containing protein [Luteolibacter rhizosphaerae]MCW1912387.1 DUF1501 domain-containing protein [Luteolibacter rhizosphaerae]